MLRKDELPVSLFSRSSDSPITFSLWGGPWRSSSRWIYNLANACASCDGTPTSAHDVLYCMDVCGLLSNHRPIIIRRSFRIGPRLLLRIGSCLRRIPFPCMGSGFRIAIFTAYVEFIFGRCRFVFQFPAPPSHVPPKSPICA